MDYYCNQKFWWLSLDLERLELQSCCAASAEKILHNNVSNNNLFNTDNLQNERRQMLNNIPADSCYSSCWLPESNGLISRRLTTAGNEKTHTNIISNPEVINIMLGRQCNMMCVYCCKQYSSTWAHNIKNFGPIPIVESGERYQLTAKDLILLKINQKEIVSSNLRQNILSALPHHYNNVKRIDISGGEPFLYLDLIKIINLIPSHIPVKIWTGLGITPKRLKKHLDVFSKKENVSLTISAESTNELYNFIRNGNNWKQFTENLNIINEYGVEYDFNATLTNLSLIGISDFYRFVNGKKVNVQTCTDPDFLSMNVLDDQTKNYILSNIANVPDPVNDIIQRSFNITPTAKQIENFKFFISNFSNRTQTKIPLEVKRIFDA